MKIMTREAGQWHLGTLPLWMEWDFQSLPTANGRTVKNILGLHLFRNSPTCLVHHSSWQSAVLDTNSGSYYDFGSVKWGLNYCQKKAFFQLEL